MPVRQQVTFRSVGHSREGGNPLFASCFGYPIRSGMTVYLFRRTVVMIHPFPEGNGRTQRIFISHLAIKMGCKLNWKKVHPWEIVQTSINVHRENDYTGMQKMVERILICNEGCEQNSSL